MKFIVRLIEEKDNLNTLYDLYSEQKTAYYVAEDEEGNIVAGLGVYKIEGNENTCEFKDYFIVESFSDSKVIIDLVNMCISFSKKYYNSVCIKITDDDLLLKNILINKKFKLASEEINSLEVLENQKIYLLKFKTVGWKNEVAKEIFGKIICGLVFIGAGVLFSLLLPEKCVEKIDFEWLMVLGTIVFVMLPCLLILLICILIDRKEKKK